MGAASAPDPAQPGDGKTAANVTEGQGRPSEPNSQDAGASASATGSTTSEAKAPPPSAPQPQQEQPQAAQPQGAQPQGPPKAEPPPAPKAPAAGSAQGPQGPAAEPLPACHYEVLGVEHNCTEDEIKKAYRELSKKYHPDKNFGCTDAKERFQRINEAKILLLDRKQRVAYDAKIYTERLLSNIGADFNQQVQQWVEFTMLQQEGWKVEHVLVALGLKDVLPTHFNVFMQQSGARFMSMHSPTQCVVLIGGAPATIKRGRELVNHFVGELNGERAPADGTVFIVPVQYQHKMPLIANHFQNWMWTYGSQIYQVGRDKEGRDRVVIRSGSTTRWPALVALMQQNVDFTGHILHTSGHYLDCWRCAHMCELNGIVNAQFISGHLLPTQRDPDKNTVRELFKYVLQLDNQQLSKMSLIDLAVRALSVKQQRQPTSVTVRAASSQAVYSEYSQLPAKQGAPLLLAFARLQSSMSQVSSFIQQRFADQNLQTLQRLGPFLDCPDAMLLRSKGFIAAKEAVPDDAQWHHWDDVLRPDGRLANFWKDFRKFIQQNPGLAKPWGVSTPPSDWYTVPDVMCDVLKRCVQGTNVLVNIEKGIFRPKEPSVPAAPPAPKTAGPPLPAGHSTSSGSGAATTAAPVEQHLTLVEHAEDVMFELSKERKLDAASYLELDMVTQKLQQRLGKDADKITKNWYSKFEVSFNVREVTSKNHSWVRLTLPGRKRADVRDRERRQKGDQKEDFEVVQRILPKLLPKKEPPTSMQEKDFCALLSLLSRETTERCNQDLPKNTLQKLAGNINTPELLRSIVPFTMTMVMQAVATLHKRGHRFEEKALLPILRAAALEMHDSDPPGRLWVPLTVVRDAVLAVCKEPFLDVFKKKHESDAKLLTASCALRLRTELVLPDTENTNLCPPCLSESYGSFRVFAELCGALATLYGAVSIHLGTSGTSGTSGGSQQEPQALMRLEEAFGKVANACQKFCNCMSSRDPRGLARLAYAFAKIGDRKNENLFAASKLGLAQVSQVIQSSDMSKEDGWDLMHLSEIACSYIQEPDQAVYKKIAATAGTLHTDHPSMLKRETLVGLITAFHQTGNMKELSAFLKSLSNNKWFKKNLNQKEVKGLHGEELLIWVIAMVNSEDFETLEELETHLKQDPRKDLDSKYFIDMLKETNACSNPKAKSFGIILQQKIIDAIARSPPRHPDLDKVVQLCSDERARSKLIDICSHRDRLERIPKPNEGSAWNKFNSSLESSLAPFVRGKCRAVRLEAAYAGRIMQGLEQCGVFESPPRTTPSSSSFVKNVFTAALHFSEDMFASMPALVQTLIQGVGNLPTAREEGEMLKALVRKMLQVGKVAEKDDALTTWTSQIEDALLKAAGSGIYEMRWSDAELTMGGKDFKQLHTKVKDALGESWLSIILARSRRLSWLPGHPIQFHPPRPRAVLRDLAEKYGEVLGQRLKNEVLALTPEAAAPRNTPRGEARSRSREREVPKAKAKAKAKAAPRAALTVFGGTDMPLGQALEGEYYKDGMNHGKFIFKKIGEDPTGSVDAVFLYFWNGEDCKEDLGWWFSDKVGGTEAFMHNPNPGAGSQPPFNGWDKGVKIQPAAFGLGAVKGKGRAKPSAARPGPVPPAKRPREEEERHIRLKQWLTQLDDGKGDMMAYYEALKEEFDGDLTQIAAARIENNPRASPVEQVEPDFWEAIKCTKGVHRLKFARGIIALPAA